MHEHDEPMTGEEQPALAEPTDEGTSHDGGVGEAGEQQFTHIPEWVSEFRRLYVEPKSPAPEVREKGWRAGRLGRVGRRSDEGDEMQAPSAHDRGALGRGASLGSRDDGGAVGAPPGGGSGQPAPRSGIPTLADLAAGAVDGPSPAPFGAEVGTHEPDDPFDASDVPPDEPDAEAPATHGDPADDELATHDELTADVVRADDSVDAEPTADQREAWADAREPEADEPVVDEPQARDATHDAPDVHGDSVDESAVWDESFLEQPAEEGATASRWAWPSWRRADRSSGAGRSEVDAGHPDVPLEEMLGSADLDDDLASEGSAAHDPPVVGTEEPVESPTGTWPWAGWRRATPDGGGTGGDDETPVADEATADHGATVADVAVDAEPVDEVAVDAEPVEAVAVDAEHANESGLPEDVFAEGEPVSVEPVDVDPALDAGWADWSGRVEEAVESSDERVSAEVSPVEQSPAVDDRAVDALTVEAPQSQQPQSHDAEVSDPQVHDPVEQEAQGGELRTHEVDVDERQPHDDAGDEPTEDRVEVAEPDAYDTDLDEPQKSSAQVERRPDDAAVDEPQTYEAEPHEAEAEVDHPTPEEPTAPQHEAELDQPTPEEPTAPQHEAELDEPTPEEPTAPQHEAELEVGVDEPTADGPTVTGHEAHGVAVDAAEVDHLAEVAPGTGDPEIGHPDRESVDRDVDPETTTGVEAPAAVSPPSGRSAGIPVLRLEDLPSEVRGPVRRAPGASSTGGLGRRLSAAGATGGADIAAESATVARDRDRDLQALTQQMRESRQADVPVEAPAGSAGMDTVPLEDRAPTTSALAGRPSGRMDPSVLPGAIGPDPRLSDGAPYRTGGWAGGAVTPATRPSPRPKAAAPAPGPGPVTAPAASAASAAQAAAAPAGDAPPSPGQWQAPSPQTPSIFDEVIPPVDASAWDNEPGSSVAGRRRPRPRATTDAGAEGDPADAGVSRVELREEARRVEAAARARRRRWMGVIAVAVLLVAVVVAWWLTRGHGPVVAGALAAPGVEKLLRRWGPSGHQAPHP